MLLKSIRIKNFRQFLDINIDIASGSDGRNVTMISGDNGTGKTTIAQSFIWCMYGTTDFDDKILLNRRIQEKMPIDASGSSDEDVLVVLEFSHGENNYIITRKQSYRKKNKLNVEIVKTEFDVIELGIDENGESTRKEYNGERKSDIINQILPEELSKYFFFDGERIEKMSKGISSRRKSNDFADAVNILLGLDGMKSAIDHMRAGLDGTVIREYNEDFKKYNTGEIKSLSEKIESDNIKLECINNRLEELENQIDQAEIKKEHNENEIKQYEEGKRLQEKKEYIYKEIENCRGKISDSIKNMCNSFNENRLKFIAPILIENALKTLEGEEIIDTDIPAINNKTIECLLNRGRCLCGANLHEDNAAYMKVKELLKYLPPQSISMCVSNFKTECKWILDDNIRMLETFNDCMKIQQMNERKIEELGDELEAVNRKLNGKDISEQVNILNNEIKYCENKLDEFKYEKEELILDKGSCQKSIKDSEAERKRLSINNEKTKRIEIYKSYAEAICEALQNEYMECEKETRKKLQNKINDVFKRIYDGGLSLRVDDKYHISIYEESTEGKVEASTGQNVSAIFAFITAIIEIARENRNSSDDSSKLLSSEEYPLVMDAPLSSFDKKRIKSGCEAIPDIADQVVIFIKNTDGDIAEKFMGDKIGIKYVMKKTDELITIIEKS